MFKFHATYLATNFRVTATKTNSPTAESARWIAAQVATNESATKRQLGFVYGVFVNHFV